MSNTHQIDFDLRLLVKDLDQPVIISIPYSKVQGKPFPDLLHPHFEPTIQSQLFFYQRNQTTRSETEMGIGFGIERLRLALTIL